MTFDEWYKKVWEERDIKNQRNERPEPFSWEGWAKAAWDHQQKEIYDLIFQRDAFQEASTSWMKSYDDLKQKYEPEVMA